MERLCYSFESIDESRRSVTQYSADFSKYQLSAQFF